MAVRKAVGAEYDYGGYQYSTGKTGVKRQRAIERAVARKKQQSFAIIAVTCTFLLTALFLTGLGYTFLQARLACYNWELIKIKEENVSLASRIEKTKLQIARQKSLERIETLAVAQLGMVKEPGIEYLAINQETRTTGAFEAGESVRGNKGTENKAADLYLAQLEANGTDLVQQGQQTAVGKTADRGFVAEALFAKLYSLFTQSVWAKG